MKIHFVCLGNTYRSRMAEAYLKSKKVPGLDVSSSGIRAKNNLHGDICWNTTWILEKKKIADFSKKKWDQTSREMIEAQDLVVFMKNEYFEYSRDVLGAKPKRYEIWNIADINEDLTSNEMLDKVKLKASTEKKFAEITAKIDNLILNLNLIKAAKPKLYG